MNTNIYLVNKTNINIEKSSAKIMLNYKWKDWCRFCGNPGFNVKFECATDIQIIFKISDQAHKICSDCKSHLTEFQEFLARSQKIGELFIKLSLENELFLDSSKINEIRAKYDLDPVDLENENIVFAEPIQVLLHTNIETKKEGFDDVLTGVKAEKGQESDNEFGLADQSSYFNQFSSDSEPEEKHEPKLLRQRKLPAKKSNNKKTTKKSERKKKTTEFCDENFEETNNPKDKDYVDKDILKKIQQKKHEKKVMLRNIEAQFLPLICHICLEDFNQKTMTGLFKHCAELHNCKPQIPCICGSILQNSEIISKHRKKCIWKRLGSLECDICGQTYRKKIYIEAHMERHKIDAIKHICSICGKQFPQAYQLKNHEIVHIPKEQRDLKFQCHICEKRFRQPSFMNNHIRRVHSEKKDYICHICSKPFKSKGGLDIHIESVHATSADYDCNVCGKKFSCKISLKSHMLVHAPKNLACPYCPLMCSRKVGLKKHIYLSHTHADLKPFKCDQCVMAFKTRGSLKNHMIVHGKTTLFKCFWCDSTFKRNYHVDRHAKSAHTREYEEYLLQKKTKTFVTPK